MSTRVFGNDVYSRSYYDDMERIEGESSEHIAEWINANLKPKVTFDAGCGSGLLMNALHKRGVTVQGIDLSPEAVSMTTAKGLPAQVFDMTIRENAMPSDKALGDVDLAISCEVAEHLEPQYAGLFVDRLIELADTVYMTAAEPDPAVGPGLYHFNEQPNAYWVELFNERGYGLDQDTTDAARAYLVSKDVIVFLAKPLIFRRRPEDS